MRRHVFSRPDDLDLDARELIAAAARRAGMSLEDWVAAVLEETQERPAPPRRKAGSDLDSLIARMSPPPRLQPKRDYEALMTAVAAESERQAQDQASRTAVALESMASWIEQAEIRLNDASTEGRALNGDSLALDIVALRGNIRRRQRDLPISYTK